MLFAFVKLQAQDYQISFAGSGEATLVETVKVQNLTQGTSLTLAGSDVLRLMGTVGIEQIKSNKNNSLLIYPNPMTSNCNIEFDVPTACLVNIEIFDIAGKKISSIQNNLQAGSQIFNVSGLNFGIYTLNVKSEKFVYSGKIISNSATLGLVNISNIGNLKISKAANIRKNIEVIVPMQYNTGERILIKAKSGNYSTVTTLVPTKDLTVTSNFVKCTDTDGNNYATVKIGNQTWMAENLNTTKYRNGEDIPNITDNEVWGHQSTGAYCIMYNSDSYFKYNGALYNWFAVMDSRNIAPIDWHMPTDAEWTTLINSLGGESSAGGKMKDISTTYDWNNPYQGASNISGFSALFGGQRYGSKGTPGSFFYYGDSGFFWSSDQYDETNAWFRGVGYSSIACFRGYEEKLYGFSVRLIKD